MCHRAYSVVPNWSSEECARLLASQATQVLGADARAEPTHISDYLTAEWNLPGVENPA